MGSADSSLASRGEAAPAQSVTAGDQGVVGTHKPEEPGASRPVQLRSDEIAELTKSAVSGAVVAWPGGAVSLLGAALCLIAVISAVIGNPLGMGMFITTVVVGGLLAILGPVVIAGNQRGIRQTVEKLSNAEGSDSSEATRRRIDKTFSRSE
jgi:hypothetical protein